MGRFCCAVVVTAVALTVVSCGDDASRARTQTVIRFDADASLTVPTSTQIHVVVYRHDEQQHDPGVDLGEASFAPDTQVVIDAVDDDGTRRFTVFAELLDDVGQRVSWARVRTGFVQNALSEVRVRFHPDCPAPPDRLMQAVGYDGSAICGSHDTCGEPGGSGSRCHGACVDPEPFRDTPASASDATPALDCPRSDCAPVESLELGWDSSCATTRDGDAFCWGQISFAGTDAGRLDRPSLILNPAGVATRDARYVQVASVIRQSCALTDAGEIRCGGDAMGGDDDRLGTGGIDTAYRQCCVVRPDPTPPPFTQIGAEAGYTCGLSRDDGAIWCTGSNPEGATGSDTYTQRRPELGFDEIHLGRNFFCGVVGGMLECFGGTNPLPGHTPIDVTDHRWIAAGLQSMCLVTATGELRCYGDDVRKTPYPAGFVMLGTGWRTVAMPQHGLEDGRDGHRCGIREDGTLWCWGENGAADPSASGPVGVDPAVATFVPEDGPMQVGAESDWTHVAVGFQHTCAVRGGGDLYCWGRNQLGQLGRPGSGFEPGLVCVPRW